MENNKICDGSDTTKDNNAEIDLITSGACIDMLPEPKGTRPCSPSESDISTYALPPPAYHVSWNVLPAAPAPTETSVPVEMTSAQSIMPTISPVAIMVPAPAVIANTLAVVQNSTLGAPAPSASARARGHGETFDFENLGPRSRRQSALIDNPVVRGARRAGEVSVRYSYELAKRTSLSTRVCILCALNFLVCMIILGVGMSRH